MRSLNYASKRRSRQKTGSCALEGLETATDRAGSPDYCRSNWLTMDQMRLRKGELFFVAAIWCWRHR